MSNNYLMKGKVYEEHKHKLVYPVIAEVKYDEIRLHVRYTKSFGVEFLSYAGKPLHNLEHWASGFKAFFEKSKLTGLDMGLLVNENFNDSYRWARSSRGVPKEKYDKATDTLHPALYHSMVQFYLFDIPESDLPYRDRRKLRQMYAHDLSDFLLMDVKEPEGWLVYSEDKLDALFVEVRERGLEGLMVKTPGHVYVAGCGARIDGWLKMKPSDPADGYIVKINRATSIEGVPLDRAGSIDVYLEDGSVASPAGIPHELGRDMLAHPEKYIGRWVEFSYMERDRQGGYRHPSFTRFREAKA